MYHRLLKRIAHSAIGWAYITRFAILHCNGNVVTLVVGSLLTTPEVLKILTSNADGDKNSLKIDISMSVYDIFWYCNYLDKKDHTLKLYNRYESCTFYCKYSKKIVRSITEPQCTCQLIEAGWRMHASSCLHWFSIRLSPVRWQVITWTKGNILWNGP